MITVLIPTLGAAERRLDLDLELRVPNPARHPLQYPTQLPHPTNLLQSYSFEIPCHQLRNLFQIQEKQSISTRMHSSRMRTGRLLTVSQHALPGGVPAGGYLPRYPPVNRITDTCKNITLPQTSFAGGNKYILNTENLLINHLPDIASNKMYNFCPFGISFLLALSINGLLRYETVTLCKPKQTMSVGPKCPTQNIYQKFATPLLSGCPTFLLLSDVTS